MSRRKQNEKFYVKLKGPNKQILNLNLNLNLRTIASEYKARPQISKVGRILDKKINLKNNFSVK